MHRTGIGRESFAGEQCADLLPRKRLSALQRTGDRSVRPAEKPFVQGEALSPCIGIVGRADPRGTQAKHPAHIFTRYQMPGRTQQVHPHDPPLLQRTPHGRCVRAGHAHADRPTGHPCVLRLHSPHPSHERGGIAGPRRGEPLAPHTQRRNGIGCTAAQGLIGHILDDVLSGNRAVRTCERVRAHMHRTRSLYRPAAGDRKSRSNTATDTKAEAAAQSSAAIIPPGRYRTARPTEAPAGPVRPGKDRDRTPRR